MTGRRDFSIAERVAFADWRLVNLLNVASREGVTVRVSILPEWDTNEIPRFFLLPFFIRRDKER